MIALRRIGVVILLGCILQLAFVLGWILLGRQGAAPWAKWSLVVVFGIASATVLYRTASEGGWGHLLLCCAWLAFGSVVIYQTLGFTMFPGLVKDIDLFSLEHAIRSLAVLGLSFVGYLLLSLVIRLPQ